MSDDLSSKNVEELKSLYENSDTNEEVKDEVVEPTEEVVEPTEEVTPDEETKVEEKPKKETEIELLKKQIEGLQSMMGKWSNEVGNVRKENQTLAEMLAKNQDKVKEASDDDPDFFAKLAKDPKGVINDLVNKELGKKRQQEDSFTQQMISNKEAVKRMVPDIEKLTNDMGDIIKEDTNNENAPEMFKQNIWNHDPSFLIVLGKRAQERAKIKELEGIIEGLKKGKKTVTTVPSAAKSGTKNVKTEYSAKELSNMNVQQLKELYGKK